MITLKSLITEGKKVTIPIGGEKITFNTSAGREGRLIMLAGSSSELDKLQDVVSFLPSRGVQNAIQSYIEKKLNVPFELDVDYPGAGYAFKVDMYSLANKLK